MMQARCTIYLAIHGSAGQCWVPRGTPRYLNACGIDTDALLVLPLDDTYRLYLARDNRP